MPGLLPDGDALRANLRRDDWLVNPPHAPVANTLSQPVLRLLGLFWQGACGADLSSFEEGFQAKKKRVASIQKAWNVLQQDMYFTRSSQNSVERAFIALQMLAINSAVNAPARPV